MQLYKFTLILARIICFVSDGILFHEFLFTYLFFLLDTDVIMTLLQYTALNIDTSIDWWHMQLKTCIYAEGRQ